MRINTIGVKLTCSDEEICLRLGWSLTTVHNIHPTASLDNTVTRLILTVPQKQHVSYLYCPNSRFADLSKTCLRHVRWWQVQTRICPYLACIRHVLDKSARWSLGVSRTTILIIYLESVGWVWRHAAVHLVVTDVVSVNEFITWPAMSRRHRRPVYSNNTRPNVNIITQYDTFANWPSPHIMPLTFHLSTFTVNCIVPFDEQWWPWRLTIWPLKVIEIKARFQWRSNLLHY